MSKRVFVVVTTDVDPIMEEDFNRWYDLEHLPNIRKVKGVISARRGIIMNGTPESRKYIAFYEHEDADVQHSDAYRKAVDTEWTRKIRCGFQNFGREVYEIVEQ